jgi:integrase
MVKDSLGWNMPKIKRVQLTKTVVDAAPASDQRYCLWDSVLGGFGLRVETSGAKTFIVRYRTEGGGRRAAQRFVTVGRFGTITPDEARKLAKTILGGVAKGDDPASERRAKRLEMKMSELIDLYEEEGCFIQRGKRQGEPMKPQTKKNTIARLRNHVVPLLGHKRASEVNTGDTERFVQDVTAGKTARDEMVGPRKRLIVRGGAGGATKVFCDLSAVFSFALRREIVTRNPCATAAVRRTGNSNDRNLTLEELTRLGKALDELEKDKDVNPKAIDIARLWALTGCRHEEIAGLKWSEIDLEEGFLQLDDTKTGKSRRPLGVAAAVLLVGIRKRKTGSSPYVFPSERGDGYYQGAWRYWDKAVAKAELPGVTPHTLRHTMGSTATSTGEALALTGAILGHSNPRSTAIYAHVQANPSKRAADRVSKKIAAALAGKPANARSSKNRKQAKGQTDKQLLRMLAQQLAGNGAEADKIRQAIAQTVTGATSPA